MQQTTQHFMHKHCTATSKRQVHNSHQELQKAWSLHLYFITQIWGGKCWLISPTLSWLPLPPPCPCNHCWRHRRRPPPPPPPPLMSTSCSQRSPTDTKKQNPSTIWEIISHFIKTVILGIINTAIITINTSRNEDSLQNFLALTHSWHAEDCHQAYTSWGQQNSRLYLATLSTMGEEKKNSIQNFHMCTMHHDITKVFYLPTNAQVSVLKTILKFTLK